MKKTLKNRNRIIVIICIFAVALVLLLFYIGQSFTALKNQEKNIVEKEMRNSISTFSEVFQTIDNSSLTIATYSHLLQFDDGNVDYSSIKDLYNTINTTLSINSYILNVTVLHNGRIIYNNNNQYLYYSMEEADTHFSFNSGVLKTVYSTNQNSSELCYIMEEDGGFRKNGVVFTLNQKIIGTNVFHSSYNDVKFIIDGEGNVILSNIMSYFGNNISDIVSPDFFDAANGEKMKTLFGERYKFTEKIPNTDMVMVCMASPDKFSAIRQQFIWNAAIVVLAILLCSFLTALVIFKISYQPINEIVTSIQDSETANDLLFSGEVDYIKKNFEALISKNRDLEESVASKTALLHQLQMHALQMQICPHFLYNTLNTINCLSYEQLHEFDNPISKTTCITADIMRNISNVGDQFLTIEKELEFTKKYVELLNIRYRNRFKVTYDIDHELLKHCILKFTFQPFVENASIHAFNSSNLNNAQVNISVKKCDDRIVISITDNGKGISDEDQKYLREEINRFEFGSGRHIGIRNVNMRIKILYGADYGVEVESELGKGSVFRVAIPLTDLEK